MRESKALGAALAVVVLAASSCGEPAGEYVPLPLPATDARVLDDGKRLRTYLNRFPLDEYEIHEVRGLGRFYIDDNSDLIKRTLIDGKPWEEAVVELLERYAEPGSVALDVGAHIGTHTLPLARAVGPLGRVYAFEPQRKIFRELHHNLRLNGANNAVPLRYALGSGPPSVVEMNPAVAGNEGGTGVGAGGDRVELRSLDSFRFKRVSLLKIDVEGFENAVLDGAVKTIRDSRPVIVVEILGGVKYEDAPPEVREQIDFTRKKIEKMGYTVERVKGHNYLALPAD